MATILVRLSEMHDRAAFDCGNPILNAWLLTTARQHQVKMLSSTYVLTEETSPAKIIGYFAISPRGFIGDELSPSFRRGLPSKVPALTIARFAISSAFQGRGIGAKLLVLALQKAKRAAIDSGGPFVFVDAKDAGSAAFYERHGFQALEDPLTLFMRTIDIP